MRESRILPDPIADYEAADGFNLWGRGREVRDVDRSLVGTEQQWAILEDGLYKYVAHVGKDLADSGEMIVMVEGQAKHDALQQQRSVIIISGTIYMPKAFNVTKHCFVRDEHRHALELPLPFDVRIESRHNLVANKFECIDECSSDKWMRQLIKEFSTMALYSVEYDPL